MEYVRSIGVENLTKMLSVHCIQVSKQFPELIQLLPSKKETPWDRPWLRSCPGLVVNKVRRILLKNFFNTVFPEESTFFFAPFFFEFHEQFYHLFETKHGKSTMDAWHPWSPVQSKGCSTSKIFACNEKEISTVQESDLCRDRQTVWGLDQKNNSRLGLQNYDSRHGETENAKKGTQMIADNPRRGNCSWFHCAPVY